MSCLVPGHPRYPRQDQLLEGACHRGRYGCGKSVAVHEALRGLPGTFVHGEERRVEVQPSQAPEFGWAGHAQRALQSGAAELQKDPEASSKVPILVLDIPRKTTEGVPLVSNFAKEMSSDRLGAAVHVIVCASSAGTAMTFDAGGSQRQENFWVEDLTEQEAQQLLELQGHGQDWKQFVASCGYNALDLVKACEHYTRPDFLEETRRDREATAREEVLRFLEQCNFQTLYSIAPAGTNILQALLANRKGGDGQGVAALSAGTAVGPKEEMTLSDELEGIIRNLAETGAAACYPWDALRILLAKKMETVLTDFWRDAPDLTLSEGETFQHSAVEPLKQSLLEPRREGAPWTTQRLCELLAQPRTSYKSTRKFMYALQRAILITATEEAIAPRSAPVLQLSDSGGLLAETLEANRPGASIGQRVKPRFLT
ncbi:PPP4R2r [Symbiodinium sp. KB8]|nr:PPP4R2r [Symbiodinium sp. KB8]